MKSTSKGFFARWAWPILILFWLASPLAFYGAFRAVRSNSNKVEDWLPDAFAETRQLNWFRKHFVADQFVIVSWDGCTLGGNPDHADAKPDDPRVEQFAAMIAPPGEVSTVEPPPETPGATAGASRNIQHYFKSATTARRVLNQLIAEPSNVPYSKALERLNGAMIGPDGQQACVILTLSDYGKKHMREAIGRADFGPLLRRAHKPGVVFDALKQCGVEPDSVRLGGPPVDNVAIDEEGERTLIRLAALSGLLGLGLAWFSLRSVKLTAIVFGCAILSGTLAMAIVWWSGKSMDAVLLSMPSLVYVLAISGSIHLINYYRDAAVEHGIENAAGIAISHGWKAALLCSVTTALGLISLVTSELEPIRKFGFFSACGVMGMLVVLFLYLPAALQVWPVLPRRSKDAAHFASEEDELQPDLYATAMDRFWGRFGNVMIRRHALVAFLCFAVIGATGYGLVYVHTSIDLLKLFDSKARILADYEWLEQKLGRLVPMEVVLRFPANTQEETLAAANSGVAGAASDNGVAVTPVASAAAPATPTDLINRFSFLERMESVVMAEKMIRQRLGTAGDDVVGQTMSAATFAPELPSLSGSTANFARRSATSKRMAANREAFEKSGYLRVDPNDGAELWRISLRVAAFEGVDYGHFVGELRNTIEPIMAAHADRSLIVREIMKSREGGSYAGAKVFLWSAKQKAASETVAASAAPVGAATGTTEKSPLHGQEIFTEALHELLLRERLRIVRSDADPAEVPRVQLEKLSQFDCVVMAGDFTQSDVEMVHGVAPLVITVGVGMETTGLNNISQAAAVDPASHHEIAAIYTGVVPIVYKAQRVLLNSLIQSTFWSFITITPLMMFVCRSIPAGAVVMIPNTLPVLLIFGGMGWLNIAVDIGSMMSASIALGVAVDDTIHFLHWFRDDMTRLGDRNRAILVAYRRCATPTLQAAVISGLGLSIFAFSTFTPTQRFGWLMLTILLAGVVAELVMLPAILAGPLGKVFHLSLRPASPVADGEQPLPESSNPPVPPPHVKREALTTPQ